MSAFTSGLAVSRMHEAERRRFDLEATIYRGGFDPKRDRIRAPRGRGHGIDPDPNIMRKYRLKGGSC
jgi:L-alanine-DL-glutamate epimerase-like enolase superfamily enzyme